LFAGCAALALLAAGGSQAATPTPSAKAAQAGQAKSAAKTPKATPKAPAKTVAAPAIRVPLPRARPSRVALASAAAAPIAPLVSPGTSMPTPTPAAYSPAPNFVPLAPSTTLTTSSLDVARVKEAIAHARAGRTAQATSVQGTIADPLARKLVEWAILRSDDNDAGFSRYAAFINANPGWPNIGLLRRRAEAMLWQERGEPASALGFFAKERPITAKGRFALARALLARGDRAGAQAQVREAWRNDSLSGDLEAQALEAFGGLLTAADHKARMDMRLYVEDVEAGLRAAERAGGVAPAIARARVAVIRKAANAKAQLDSVPAEARRDIGYVFSLVQWLRRNDQIAEAAALILALPRDPAQAIDTDQWWIERRLVARKLLDADDPKTAYLVARDAAVPSKENYRAEHQFTAGWIALRFLDDPATALAHFAHVAQGIGNPIALARAGYWQGRAAEALGRKDEARAHYDAAARHGTAYYGQLARARLGYKDVGLRPPPDPGPERRAAVGQSEVVRAAELLYAAGERDLVVSLVADLGERSTDIHALAALGGIAGRNHDARAMLLIGKAALGRGYALEHYAFPTIGIPDYRSIGPAVERSVVYSIARQESIFNQRTVSSAKAMGLMQVTPEAGRETAKKFGATYDGKRLLSDPVYNVQMGAAELGDLIEGYRGSYILTFAGYNAGRGRIREWLSRYGDPRDPKVDPIDWVERIPFSETRNYVQRVMENLQVYRVRFGSTARLLIEADLHRGTSTD
jgi:soluble lytic murein transglycosylase